MAVHLGVVAYRRALQYHYKNKWRSQFVISMQYPRNHTLTHRYMYNGQLTNAFTPIVSFDIQRNSHNVLF